MRNNALDIDILIFVWTPEFKQDELAGTYAKVSIQRANQNSQRSSI